MRIGIVSPYSFDVPGGVQIHIQDLATELVRRGHFVSVLAPSESDDHPDWFVPAGPAVAIRFNGSVARLSYGPRAAGKTKKWLEDGNFDVVHIHEPGTPSLGMHALKNADVPVVATFHSAMERSTIRTLTAPIVRPLLEKISARIAVSNEARRTLVEHHGGDAIIIPNGVETSLFKEATPTPEWEGSDDAPVIVFLGRLDESRKGLPVFEGAIEPVLEEFPNARFLVAGRGDAKVLESVLKRHPDNVTLLGEISDEEKASLLSGATLYIAPQTGGESFGIVLVEAMAAGTAVVASDIAAFAAVLDNGNAGDLFSNRDSKSLAEKIAALLRDPERVEALAAAGLARSAMYDWGTVTDQIMAVYEEVVDWGAPPVTGTAYETVRSKMGKADPQ